MARPLNTLIIEDRADDAELLLVELRRAGFAPNAQRVETEGDFLASLDSSFDVILADFTMPRFGTLRALELLRERRVQIPLIVVTGTVGEDVAAECIKQGAVDYLLKDRLGRLGQAVEAALAGRQLRADILDTEQALRATSIRKQAVLDASLDGIITIDHQGAILEFNPAAEKIFGYVRDEVLGRQVEDLIIPPRFRDRHERGLERYLRTGTSQFIGQRQELPASRADGSEFPAEITIVPVRLAQTTTPLFIGFVRDISTRLKTESALRESEAKNRALLRAVPDLLLVVDRRALILDSADPRGNDVLPAAESGRNLCDLLPTEYGDAIRACLSQVNEDTKAQVLEFALTNPSRHFEARFVALDADQVLVLMRDITERRATEEDRRRFDVRLQQAQKLESLETLAGGVAHQFNNLLTVILGHASLVLHESAPGSPLAHAVQQIESAAQRAADLTQLLLACSGRARRTLRPVNLTNLVRSLEKPLQRQVEGKAVLVYELSQDMPGTQADGDQLAQVVINLVANAAEAIEGDQGRITIRTGVKEVEESWLAALPVRHSLRPGRSVFLEVIDTGIGIKAEELPRIFDPFYTTKFTGRGLGLAAVLGIVRSHGGAIAVHAKAETGTCFEVLLAASGGTPPGKRVSQQFS